MSREDFPTEDFINRRIDYRFAGCGIRLDLSLGLFSSAGVDTGSMLLLKTIAGALELDTIKTVLDIGCGAGTLGLALAARCSEADVTMVDRDALAVEFTRHNALLNKLANVNTFNRLMTEGPHQHSYDLVMSNFPAKAGDQVLKDYLRWSMALTGTEGRGALVIVHTLAELCRDLISDLGGILLLEESSKQHTVFHYRSEKSDASEFPASDEVADLTPYIRQHSEFKLKRTRYELDTVWNIGDFDTHSWRIKLMGELLDAEALRGDMAFWAPGQGHFPAMVCQRRGARPGKLILADRDRLALQISERNILSEERDLLVEAFSLGDPSLLDSVVEQESLDFLMTDLSPVPRSHWTDPLKNAAATVVKIGGLWAVLGRSNDIAALVKYSRGWTPVADRRNKGWRAMILRRNP